jgi:predicted peptidase
MKQSKFTSNVLMVLFIIVGSISFTYAQTSRFSFNEHVNSNGDKLIYRMLIPDYDTISKYPLVIFLHGSGERGNDNEAQLKWGVLNFATDQAMSRHPSFIIAPQCPEKQRWSNLEHNSENRELRLKAVPGKPMELLIELIHEFIKNNPVDTNRIYITGLSMGGYGTYDAIQRYPDLFAAAVPVCGAGDISKADTIAHIPIWIFHGALDTAVNPLYSHDMVKALTDAGSNPGFTQYPNVGHFSWLKAYSDPNMMSWLFRQYKE